jgi:hypothetical protein
MNKTPHVHAALIKAWADGAIIQYKNETTDTWMTVSDNCFFWLTSREYRIKPEPKPDAVYYVVIDKDTFSGVYRSQQSTMNQKIQQVKLLFDGETGEFKLAEKV